MTQSVKIESLNKLLSDTHNLIEKINYLVYNKLYSYGETNDIRLKSFFSYCNISLEHGNAMRILIKNRQLNSAIALLRLQYESLVRSVWIYYLASNDFIYQLNQELSEEYRKLDNKMPTINEMLDKIDEYADNEKLPKKISVLLHEFKNNLLKYLHSHIHSGTLAFSREKTGYPVILIMQILQNSNGLVHFMNTLIATILKDDELLIQLIEFSYEYRECFPMTANDIIQKNSTEQNITH